MQVVTIRDKWARQNQLAVDLIDVLRLLLPFGVEESGWLVVSAWVVRPGGEILDLYEGVEDVRRVPGATLLGWAARLTPVIACEVYGFRPGSSVHWVAIHGFDSSVYDVASADEGVIQCIRERFHDVKDWVGPTPQWAVAPSSEWPVKTIFG